MDNQQDKISDKASNLLDNIEKLESELIKTLNNIKSCRNYCKQTCKLLGDFNDRIEKNNCS